MSGGTAQHLVTVDGLVRHFNKPRRTPFSARDVVQAVNGVSFHIRPGEALGVVGESGCGKSTIGRIVVGVDAPTAGHVIFEDTDIASLSKSARRQLNRDIQMIFQNPVSALDPRIPMWRQVREPLDIHGIGTPQERDRWVAEMLAAVGLAPEISQRYAHEISGGQAQRVVIARAVIMKPKLLVCDEPVSALDVSVQSQVIDLLVDLQKRFGMAYLFISHDLKVVKRLCHRVAVMYLGEVVEEGQTDDVFDRPRHPYTKALISAIPNPDPNARHDRIILHGDPPSPIAPPAGCRFHTRCPSALPACATAAPETRTFGTHTVACHLVDG